MGGKRLDRGRTGARRVTVTKREKRVRDVNVELPGRLGSRYVRVVAMATRGAEADLFEGTKADRAREVVKIYRYGIETNDRARNRIRSIDSERLVRILDTGHTRDGREWEIVEHIAQGTLREVLEEGAKGRERLILEQLTEAISLLHEKDIEHRDVKPENILVRSREPLSIALGDFGISSVVQSTMHLTRGGGTLGYTPPESFNASGTVVRRAWDWWALGMVMVESLTGSHPFEGVGEGAIGYRLATADTTDLVEAIENREWRELCRGLLRREPRERWAKGEIARWMNDPRDPGLNRDTDTKARKDLVLIDDGEEIRHEEDVAEMTAMNPARAISLWKRRAGDIVYWLKRRGSTEKALALGRIKGEESQSRILQGLEGVFGPAPSIGGEVSDARFRDWCENAARGERTAARRIAMATGTGTYQRSTRADLEARRKEEIRGWEKHLARYREAWGRERVDLDTRGYEIAELVVNAQQRYEHEWIERTWSELTAKCEEAMDVLRLGTRRSGQDQRERIRHAALGWVLNAPGARRKASDSASKWVQDEGVDIAARTICASILDRTAGETPGRPRHSTVDRVGGTELGRSCVQAGEGAYLTAMINRHLDVAWREEREEPLKDTLARAAQGDEAATQIVAGRWRDRHRRGARGERAPERCEQWEGWIEEYRRRWRIQRVHWMDAGAEIALRQDNRGRALSASTIAGLWRPVVAGRAASVSADLWGSTRWKGEDALAWIVNVPGTRRRIWKAVRTSNNWSNSEGSEASRRTLTAREWVEEGRNELWERQRWMRMMSRTRGDVPGRLATRLEQLVVREERTMRGIGIVSTAPRWMLALYLGTAPRGVATPGTGG